MATDEQDTAETYDEDMIGTGTGTGTGDAVTIDEVEVDFPPERPVGLPFADSDVTDESFAQRSLQEEPEISDRDLDERDVTDTKIDGDVDVQDLAAFDDEPI